MKQFVLIRIPNLGLEFWTLHRSSMGEISLSQILREFLRDKALEIMTHPIKKHAFLSMLLEEHFNLLCALY